MMLRNRIAGLFLAIGFILSSITAVASPPLFVDDAPYLQKRAVKFTTRNGLPTGAIDAVAFCAGTMFAGAVDGVYALSGEKWGRSTPTGQVFQLGCIHDRLYAAAQSGFYAIPPKATDRAKALYSRAATAFTQWHDGFLIASGDEAGGVLFFSTVDSSTREFSAFKNKRVRALATDMESRVWAATDIGIASFADNKLTYHSETWDNFDPKKDSVRYIFPVADGKVYFATSHGIGVYDHGVWSALHGKPQGLPVEDVTAVAALDDTLVAGFSTGAARFKTGEWEYMQSGRWLPNDHVRAALIAPDGSLWFGTNDGVGKIEYATMTLSRKASYFQNLMPLFLRRSLTGDATITVPGDFSSIKTKTHDNENVWTGMYMASQCFRYAVTREPDAKHMARASLDSMLFLETVTGIPGLFARSYAASDEEISKGGEWHPTADGKWRWKGDTSSDEAVGRFFGFSVYFDLCADDSEKQLIAGSISRTMNRIIDDGYYILDIDGKPTQWGRWNPQYLSTKGRFQKNLNSLEILMMLKTAYHFTGEPRFQDEYLKLIKQHGYARSAINAKIHLPRMQNHSDDLLAFLSYYPLLKYEKDSTLLEDYYYKSIRRTWRIVREKRNPLWNYIYGAAVPGDDFDPADSAWFLRRSPLDLIYWDVRNSHRADLDIDPNEGTNPGEMQSIKPLPPDETFMLKFNENPYRLDGYWKGNNAENPSYWLLPYWMGRYHGFIR